MASEGPTEWLKVALSAADCHLSAAECPLIANDDP